METEPSVWPRAKISAFWDRGRLTYEKWLRVVNERDARTISQSVGYMRPADFIELVGGDDAFAKMWPECRDMVQEREYQRVSDKMNILDALWSMIVVGDVGAPVAKTILEYPRKKKSTFKAVLDGYGRKSIYEIAKKMNRNYRRVFDDIKSFETSGFVVLRRECCGARMVCLPVVLSNANVS